MIYNQTLSSEDYDFIEKRMRQTFEDLRKESYCIIWMARRFKTPSNSSGNSHIFDSKHGDGNFISGKNKIAHRANFVTKNKFKINDIYKEQHSRRRDVKKESRL